MFLTKMINKRCLSKWQDQEDFQMNVNKYKGVAHVTSGFCFFHLSLFSIGQRWRVELYTENIF